MSISRFEDAPDAFGQIIHPQCIGCQRRTAKGEPMPVPEFTISCPKKVSEE